MIEHLPVPISNLIQSHGDVGLFVAMFLESSIIPIPSELVIAAAGAIGIPVMKVVVWGSIGSTLGAMVGYVIGRFAGLPFILRFGKYLFIKEHHIQKAQDFAAKHGVWGVLVGRILPIIPFKVFSIAAGMTRISFVPFVICTAVGVVPRLYLLAKFGELFVKYTKVMVLAAVVVVLIWFLWHKFVKK